MPIICSFVTIAALAQLLLAFAFSVVAMFIPVTLPFLTMSGFGLAGLVGLVGSVGLAGLAGLAGLVVSVGLAGLAGLVGLVGLAGLAGLAGLVGLVGGSIAAYFWGPAAVAASWFALLQATGMGAAILMWVGALIKVLLAIGGYLSALLLQCFCRFVTTALAQLLPALAFSVVAMFIPATWILMPFLSMFDFGLAGPVRGSIAAWLQSYFWGAAVAAASWFALLRATAMGAVIPMWVGLLIKVPLAIGGYLLAPLLQRFDRG